MEFSWARRQLEFVQREMLGDPVFRAGTAAIQAQRAARSGFTNLWDAEVKVYSQWGEDGILDFLCDLTGLSKPICLELGVGDYRECNTRFLAEYRGSPVTMVDARPDLVRSVRSLPAYWRTTLDPRQQWITPDNVSELVARAHEIHGGLDLVSLDIDGNDYWVAEQLDLAGVTIVVVEYQPLFGNTRPVSVPRKDDFNRAAAHYSHLYYGASLPAFTALFKSKGFVLVGTNRAGNNAFFVNESAADRVALAPFDISITGPQQWSVRESRNRRGRLDHVSGSSRVQLIADLPVIDVSSGEMLSVRQAID